MADRATACAHRVNHLRFALQADAAWVKVRQQEGQLQAAAQLRAVIEAEAAVLRSRLAECTTPHAPDAAQSLKPRTAVAPAEPDGVAVQVRPSPATWCEVVSGAWRAWY